MIEVQSLRKLYGDLVAVDGISFTAQPGAIFGLLGPNGAGKSTTIHCIAGLLKPSAGSVRVVGHDVDGSAREARRVLGVVPQELALYEDLSAYENVWFWGGAYGLRGPGLDRRARAALDATGLLDRAKEPVKRFSGGMKRRLNFACGIVHEPKVLLLDEPTVGVDPQSRVKILDLVRELVRSGTCVLYTTHYMEEAEALCDRLAVVDHGKIVAQGTLDELRAMTGERDLVRVSGRFDTARALEALRALDDVEVVSADAALVTAAAAEAARRLPAVLAALAAAGGEIRETTVSRPTLETLFIKLTGKELRE